MNRSRIVLLLLPALFGSALVAPVPGQAPQWPPAGQRLEPDSGGGGGESKVLTVNWSGTCIRSNLVEGEVIGTRLEGFQMAVILDQTFLPPDRLTPADLQNVPETDWIPLQERFEIDLGPGEGERNVWCGFRSPAGKIHWQRHRITVDRTPPEIVISKPEMRTVTEPVIQVIGYSPEPLSLLTAEVLRPGAGATSASISVTERVFDRTQRKHTQTHFQCYDLLLSDGTNTLVITATDLAGNSNVAQFNFLLDAASDQTPPEITVHWPGPDDEVNARTFRLRGRISKAGARVRVEGLTPEPVEGSLGRNGLFSVPNLPLPDETNELTVVVTDYAGNVNSKTLTVRRGAIEITIDELPPAEQASRTPTLTGTVSDPDCTVWVNGLKAEMEGSRWRVKMRPPSLDVGLFQAVAIPNSVNGGNGFGAPRRPTLEDMGNPRLRP